MYKPDFIEWCKSAGPLGPLLYLMDLLVTCFSSGERAEDLDVDKEA